jgi:hypothetical protein
LTGATGGSCSLLGGRPHRSQPARLCEGLACCRTRRRREVPPRAVLEGSNKQQGIYRSKKAGQEAGFSSRATLWLPVGLPPLTCSGRCKRARQPSPEPQSWGPAAPTDFVYNNHRADAHSRRSLAAPTSRLSVDTPEPKGPAYPRNQPGDGGPAQLQCHLHLGVSGFCVWREGHRWLKISRAKWVRSSGIETLKRAGERE